ncbi:MAG: exonuclease [Gammaproteobacteria bacterium]|nr:exonuclease [Gammaproteobacteria bacterium]
MPNRNPKHAEIYVSTDIEADGPIPGPHSMLSLASAAYDEDLHLLDSFSVNLETLPDAGTAPRTMEWWAQFPESWAACRTDPQDPAEAMSRYLKWLKNLPGKPIFVGWPAGWDFMWVYWYLVRFTGERPFREISIDVRSYAMGMRGTNFHRTTRTYLPDRWFDTEQPHTHVALDDALEQGTVFCRMLGENLRRKG